MCTWGWVNGGEKKLLGSYTEQECINTVRQQHPTANGATMPRSSLYNKQAKHNCYAGYKKELWDRGYRYRACKFKDAKKNKIKCPLNSRWVNTQCRRKATLCCTVQIDVIAMQDTKRNQATVLTNTKHVNLIMNK